MDRRGRLGERPFSYALRGDGRVTILFNDRVVATLRGDAAERFRTKVVTADEDTAQHLMARATGNFKHGNERR